MNLDIEIAKEIEIKEATELQPLLEKNIDKIEEGLKLLKPHLQTDTGPLDILAVDAEGVLVIIELKNEEDDGQLDQGIRYYDWIRTNRDTIANAFKSIANIDSTKDPRLILIAPSFSDILKKVAKYTTLFDSGALELKEYHILKINDERALFLKSDDIGELPKPIEVPTIEDKKSYIKSNTTKQIFEEILMQLENLKIEIRPIHGHWMALWHNGKRFGYLATRRNWLLCSIEQQPSKDWTDDLKINTKEEWDKVFIEYVEPAYKYIKNKKAQES